MKFPCKLQKKSPFASHPAALAFVRFARLPQIRFFRAKGKESAQNRTQRCLPEMWQKNKMIDSSSIFGMIFE